MSKVMAVRLSDELAARVGEVAASRSMKPAAWLREAVAFYLDDHSRAPRSVGRVVVAPAGAGRGRSVRVDSVSQVQRWALERQAKLNDAKGGSK